MKQMMTPWPCALLRMIFECKDNVVNTPLISDGFLVFSPPSHESHHLYDLLLGLFYGLLH